MNTFTENKKNAIIKTALPFTVLAIAFIALFFTAVNTGSIKVGFAEILKGLLLEYNADVATIFDLRFPRVVISAVAGAAIACSGVLFQAVLKNPLADPGIIGISSGAGFVAVVATALFPALISLTPLFGFLGGMFAFALVYLLSWKQGFSPLRILLVGIAIQSMFTGLSSAVNSMSGGNMSGVASIVNGNITMKTWNDVHALLLYAIPGLILALTCHKMCDLLALEDKTVSSLGVNIVNVRLYISTVAVLLASGSTAIVGVIGFLGLLVPHIGRLIIGNRHNKLIPFSMLLGAFVFLLADTLGRSIMPPYDISSAVIMSVIGGPTFIILLKRSGYKHGAK